MRRDVCDGRGMVTQHDTCGDEGTARVHVQWERHDMAAWSTGAEARDGIQGGSRTVGTWNGQGGGTQ